MAIVIGAKPESSFQQPLGLLQDCHRRIERFLEQLLLVTEQARGEGLTDPQCDALQVALRYFRQAAPLHTADEESSLFPRLRALDSAEARAALAALAALEADHDRADAAHAEIDTLGKRWLNHGCLTAAETARLSELLHELRVLYRRHIGVEDREIFPLAGRVLEPDAITALGREMAERRGVDPDTPLTLSRCSGRRGAL